MVIVIGTVDNVDNWRLASVNDCKKAVENFVDWRCVSRGTTAPFPRMNVRVGTAKRLSVDELAQVVPPVLRMVCTPFPQLLRIESLPYFCYLFADREVELDSFFDFFDRMYGSSMIFAAKLTCYLWEAEMKLTTEKIHSDLAWRDDVFVALFAANFDDAE